MKENKFGGERLESKSSLSRNNLLEHLARYQMVEGDKGSLVLDIGCGAGHGSNILSKKFSEVKGVDISSEAIEYARENWSQQNIEFIVGSALNIPFDKETFDIVTAFEVFEHIEDWRSFLLEVKRVLKKDGVLFISTPNKDMYSPGTKKPINPHHFFEMTVPEFRAALQEFFDIKDFWGQRTPVYNDHFIWRIVNPFLFLFKNVLPYKVNNTIKLKIINWIKPELQISDIVIKKDQDWINKSRFIIATCSKI